MPEMAKLAEKLKERARDFIRDNTLVTSDVTSDAPSYFLAGGCFSSWAWDTTPKDYDIFVLKSSLQFVLQREVATSKSEFVTKEGNYYGNPNILATALHMPSNIQLIFSNFKTRREVIDDFDMDHCCISYVPYENKLYASYNTLSCIMRKEIQRHKNNKIESWRINKMTKKGWTDCTKVPAFL